MRNTSLLVWAFTFAALLRDLIAISPDVMGSFSFRGQRVIEASVVGVDQGGVVVRGKDTGVVIVPLEEASKTPQLTMRANLEIKALLDAGCSASSLTDRASLPASFSMENGEVLERSSSRAGPCSVQIINNTSSDAVIKLASAKRCHLFTSIFVAKGSVATLADIHHRIYRVFYALGHEWDRRSASFLIQGVTEGFVEPLDFRDDVSSPSMQAKIFLNAGARPSALSIGDLEIGTEEISVEEFDSFQLDD